MPTISTSELMARVPRSARPVTTVPRPVIVKTSSIGIRNGLSLSRIGSGMDSSTAVHEVEDALRPLLVALESLEPETRTTGALSPSKSWLESSSRTSSSTSSRISSSSTMSALFSATSR
jgi:hypothetical protein